MSQLIRLIGRSALVALGLTAGFQAQAASVTVDAGAACTAFTWNQSTSTLSCQVSTDCVISGPSTGTPGTAIALSASCPTSSTITWSGGTCAGVTGTTCNPNEGSTGNVTYTASGNTSAAGTKVVNWTNTVTQPGGCSLTANPSSGSAATNVTLTAACTSGTLPITLAWSGAAGTGSCPTSMSSLSTTCTINNVAATSTWTVNFSNSANNNSKSATFTYNAGGGGGAFAGCPSDALKIDGQWGNTAITTSDYGGFGGNILSIRVAPPSTWVASSTKTSSWANYIASAVEREYAVSTKACDFGDGVEGDVNILRNGYGYPVRYFVGPTSFDVKYRSTSASAGAVRFVPGSVYYINVRNRSASGASTCGGGECTMRGGLPN